MAISKIVYKSSQSATPVTWMDATTATATASDISAPKTAMLADGVMTEGTGTGSGGSTNITIEQLSNGGEHYIINSGSVVAEADWNDVCFWDYDGTIKYSYSASEFANLTSMPPNPTHTGLVSQGWNWSLSDAKTHVQTYGCLDIGQLYITDDNKTRLYINVTDLLRPKVRLRLKMSTANKLHLDWGDGSTIETNESTGGVTYDHDYVAIGKYIIKLWSDDNVVIQLGMDQNAFNQSLFGNGESLVPRASVSKLYKVEIGANIKIGNSCFSDHNNLSSITMSTATTFVHEAGPTFNNTALKTLILPTAFGQTAKNSISNGYLKSICFAKQDFVHCSGTFGGYRLKRICIPVELDVSNGIQSTALTDLFIYDGSSYTAISASSIINAYSLIKLTVPANITSIGNTFVSNAYSMKELHMLPASPPTLGGTTFCSSRPSDFVIYVPYSSDHSVLEAYQTATNWSSLASYMQEESQS